MYAVKEFVCLSVRLLPNLPPIIFGLAKQNGLKFFLGHLWQKGMSQKILFVRKVAGRAVAEVQKSNILTKYLSCLTWDQAEISKIYLNIPFEKKFATLAARAVFEAFFVFKKDNL